MRSLCFAVSIFFTIDNCTVINYASHSLKQDTEFPGIVCRPIAHFQNAADYQYQQVCTNVNLLRLIQVGITFFDEQGRVPSPQSTWQFNFRFSLKYYI